MASYKRVTGERKRLRKHLVEDQRVYGSGMSLESGKTRILTELLVQQVLRGHLVRRGCNGSVGRVYHFDAIVEVTPLDNFSVSSSPSPCNGARFSRGLSINEGSTVAD